MRDQAERLRQLASQSARPEGSPLAGGQPPPDPALAPDRRTQAAPRRQTEVLAILSGKGGTGKTNLAVNLAYALKGLGQWVTLMDADLGLANVDVLLGTTPRYHLGHLLSGQRSLQQLLYSGPEGLRLIAGGSGLEELAELEPPALLRLLDAFQSLEATCDFLLLDGGAGLHRSATALAAAADSVVVVTTPEPTAITDAYALIKVLIRRSAAPVLYLVINQAHDRAEANAAANRLCEVSQRFLRVSPVVLEHVPYDPQVARSVRRQEPFFLAAPACAASHSVAAIAHRLVGDRGPRDARPFFERLRHWLRPNPPGS